MKDNEAPPEIAKRIITAIGERQRVECACGAVWLVVKDFTCYHCKREHKVSQ